MMLWSTRTNDEHLLLGRVDVGQHGFVSVFSSNGNLGMLIRHSGHYSCWWSPFIGRNFFFSHWFYFQCILEYPKCAWSFHLCVVVTSKHVCYLVWHVVFWCWISKDPWIQLPNYFKDTCACDINLMFAIIVQDLCIRIIIMDPNFGSRCRLVSNLTFRVYMQT